MINFSRKAKSFPKHNFHTLEMTENCGVLIIFAICNESKQNIFLRIIYIMCNFAKNKNHHEILHPSRYRAQIFRPPC